LIGVIAISTIAWRGLLATEQADNVSQALWLQKKKGRRCGAPRFDAAAGQSIFQAEKITLGTAGSPAGFL
jgi:hypothetical protein